MQGFAEDGADLITALTMTHVGEAVGIARAAAEAGIPAVISFTVETDGRLPDGTLLSDAILAADAATGRSPAHYMVNCAHPTHIAPALCIEGPWIDRLAESRQSVAEEPCGAERDPPRSRKATRTNSQPC